MKIVQSLHVQVGNVGNYNPKETHFIVIPPSQSVVWKSLEDYWEGRAPFAPHGHATLQFASSKKQII
jgi:hypothetical protein